MGVQPTDYKGFDDEKASNLLGAKGTLEWLPEVQGPPYLFAYQ
jgi:hypothetical protein